MLLAIENGPSYWKDKLGPSFQCAKSGGRRWPGAGINSP